MYLLAGDEDGYLSVLPARLDSKFFAIDVWQASLKHQVGRFREGVLFATARKANLQRPVTAGIDCLFTARQSTLDIPSHMRVVPHSLTHGRLRSSVSPP